MGFQSDLALQSRVDAIGSNHEIRIDGRSVRKRQVHATICFGGGGQAMTQLERAFRQGSGEQLQKVRTMNIVARDTSGRARRRIASLTDRCPDHLAGYWTTYL